MFGWISTISEAGKHGPGKQHSAESLHYWEYHILQEQDRGGGETTDVEGESSEGQYHEPSVNDRDPSDGSFTAHEDDRQPNRYQRDQRRYGDDIEWFPGELGDAGLGPME